MKKTLMRQVRLSQQETHQVLWVDRIDELTEGCRVKLKGEDSLWRVDKLYPIEVYKDEIKTKWNVGGL